MSYILDALKKADAERERDRAAVPDLHAQGDAASGPRASPRRAVWAGLAVAVALGALAWSWFGGAPDTPPASLAQAPAPAQLAPVAPPASTTPMRTAPPPLPLPPPAPLRPPALGAPPPAPVPPNPAPAAPNAAALPIQRPATTAAAPPSPARPPAAARADVTPAPPASAAREPRLYALAELPADVRGQLPALTVGGSVYSPQAASRIVILNGQVFHEGDKPIEGLTVEQIGLKSTVLAFRGLRFELKH